LNYDHLFTHISSIIKDADLSFIEQEKAFDVEEPNKYKEANKQMPKELGDSLASAGFNVILHANIHAFDQKEKGIKDTLEFWRTKYPYIQNLGISTTVEESQKDYIIYTKDDLKIGIINYACGAFNGISKDNEFMVNSLDIRKAEEMIKKVKSEVDFLIFYLNWGDKDYYLPSRTQIRIAKILAWHGVDLIIGNMPNVIFPVSFLKPESGKEILVFWSVGSLIGKNALKYNCLGALANVVITKSNGKAYISSHSLIPIISHQIQSEFTFYKFSEYTLDLGYRADEEFSMEKVQNKCKTIFGPFADC
jgi:poly-gamma-glutamate synthesis protein (capsule biosynthesis protein)